MTSEASDDAPYHVITRKSRARVIVIAIPSQQKPLTAHVAAADGGITGVLASYYDPGRHAWVVKQHPAKTEATLTVRVVTLVDPEHRYDVRISLCTLLDVAREEEAYELKARSQAYQAWREVRTERDAVDLPVLEDSITLACPLDVFDGFVLCGGGFVSDYPVVRSGPSMPRAVSMVYDRLLHGELVTEEELLTLGKGKKAGPAVTTTKRKSASSPLSSTASPPLELPAENAEDEDIKDLDHVEFTAWSVTATPNAGLACFSIGIRRRSPAEWGTDCALLIPGAASRLALPWTGKSREAGGEGFDTVNLYDEGVVSTLHNEGGDGRRPRRRSAAVVSPAMAAQQREQQRHLLSVFMLRHSVQVRMTKLGTWSMTLPPPHGSFQVRLDPCKELNRAVQHYYQHA